MGARRTDIGANRDTIISFLDQELNVRGFADACPNGLQTPGRLNVQRVATAVSCSLAVFEQAAAWQADMLIVHHGLFWDGAPRHIDLVMKTRLSTLFHADISLVAYHLPLDAHRTWGNNVLAVAGLGADLSPTDFGAYRGRSIGAVGAYTAALSASEFRARLRALFGGVRVHAAGAAPGIRSFGVVTGSGGSSLAEATSLGLDAFVTGEPSEPGYAVAMESHVHFFAVGHYDSEKLGVRRLGGALVDRFGVDTTFIDAPNPA